MQKRSPQLSAACSKTLAQRQVEEIGEEAVALVVEEAFLAGVLAVAVSLAAGDAGAVVLVDSAAEQVAAGVQEARLGTRSPQRRALLLSPMNIVIR